MEQKLLSASANTGIGLWTSICVAFSKIGGVESNKLTLKQSSVLEKAKRRLESRFKDLGEGWVLSDFRVTWSNLLEATVTALATKE